MYVSCLKMNRFQRSIPFFRELHRSNRRKSLLARAPKYVISDLSEILYNIVSGNIKIPNRVWPLAKSQRFKLGKLYRYKSHNTRKKFLGRQNGGFIGALLPLVAAVIGATI